MGAIYKTLIMDGKISLSVIESTDIVNSAIKYHNLTPLTAAALGRTMTATVFILLGLFWGACVTFSMLKENPQSLG